MLSITECKKILEPTELDDKEIEELRNSLYFVIGNLLDYYHEKENTTKR